MNIDAAILADPSKRGTLILEILNYYVPEVMQTMAGLSLVPGTGNPSAPQPSLLKGVTGSIGLSGKVTGIVYTAFQDQLAKVVAENLTDFEIIVRASHDLSNMPRCNHLTKASVKDVS